MAKSDYIPHPDSDLLIWHDRFKVNLLTKQAELGISKEDIMTLETDNNDLHSKIIAASTASAAARHATAEKSAVVTQQRIMCAPSHAGLRPYGG